MQSGPRAWRNLRRGAVIAAVVCCVLWLVTQWWYVCVVNQRWRVGIESGWFRMTCLGPVVGFGDEPGVYAGRLPVRRHDLWLWLEKGRTSLAWRVPLWAPLAPVVVVAATGWVYRASVRRWGAHAGRCAKCRYDLAGLPAGAVCPECGAAPGGG